MLPFKCLKEKKIDMFKKIIKKFRKINLAFPF